MIFPLFLLLRRASLLQCLLQGCGKTLLPILQSYNSISEYANKKEKIVSYFLLTLCDIEKNY